MLAPHCRAAVRMLLLMDESPWPSFGGIALAGWIVVLIKAADKIVGVVDIKAPIALAAQDVNEDPHQWAVLDLNQ